MHELTNNRKEMYRMLKFRNPRTHMQIPVDKDPRTHMQIPVDKDPRMRMQIPVDKDPRMRMRILVYNGCEYQILKSSRM